MSPMWTQSATPVQGPHAGVASGSLPWTTGLGVGLRDRRRRDHPQVTESWTAPELQPPSPRPSWLWVVVSPQVARDLQATSPVVV